MFDDIKIEILGNSPINEVIKGFYGDLQEPKGDKVLYIEIEKLKFDITKILYIDYIESLINMNTYLKVEDTIYKVMRVKTYNDHMEVYLYQLRKQVN